MKKAQDANVAWLEGVEHERRRQESELHDTVCQSLAGISLFAKLLLRRVEAGHSADAAEISRIAGYLDLAIDQIRLPMKIQSLLSRETGLSEALAELSAKTATKARCRFSASKMLRVEQPDIARAFYRIASESIRHLLAHGVEEIDLSLAQSGRRKIMEVRYTWADASAPSLDQEGEFFQRYAEAVGARFVVLAGRKNQTVLRCSYPARFSKARHSIPRGRLVLPLAL